MTSAVDASNIVVRLNGIQKTFGATKVLQGIELDFRKAEVHAIVGENGAGKSTLGKIVGGYYSFDSGTLEVFGQRAMNWTPRRALQHGIAMIHQELQLVPALTVAQNVFLGTEENRLGVLRGTEVARFHELDERCNFGLDPKRVVKSLRIAERQKVEIMRAIARDARVIVMDEPTSSLTADETERLHRVIAWLTAEGCTVIYVTHFLEHALAVSDRVTVMRDGRVVQTSKSSETTKTQLVEAMLGASVNIAFPAIPPAPSDKAAPALEVRGVSTHTGLQDISLIVRPGEIVGLIGLVGSGRSETLRAIFGADPLTEGQILVAGKMLGRGHRPGEAVRRGIALIPEDRRKQGLVLPRGVRHNISLPHLSKIQRAGIVRSRQERERTRTLIDHLGIRPGAVDGAVALYSGGNQQKVLLAKWMFERPHIVLLDEPSRGVDIGARRRIHEIVVEFARTGTAVLLVSSDLEEVLGLAHRAYLIRQGRIIGEVDSKSASREDVLFRLFEGKSPAGDEKAIGTARETAQ